MEVMSPFFENPGLFHIGKKILRSMDIATQATCRTVCKTWNNEIVDSASKITLEHLKELLEKCAKARSMNPEEHGLWKKFLVRIFKHSKSGGPKPNLFVKLYLKDFFVKNFVNELQLKKSPFYDFLYTGNVKMVEFILLNHNFYGNDYSAICQVCSDLQFAIRFAIQRHQSKMVKVLAWFATATSNVMNMRGNTHIHEAAQEGNLESVKLLVTCISNPHISNSYGKSAMDLARENGHSEIEVYLKQFPKPL